ncbi:MAG: AmmeMemoRadiSam system protein A [Candidatus Nomurabacteria bacterium]|jgi:AmmeMemoRadiSam system protein A/AmmeMemoRadiSam system protein B|nr:AmmeMemoRadiSam system protein A [Candidatus Nomurabacteria bacterium]
MSIISTYLVPHPPLIFPEIGRGEERKIEDTIKAYKKVAAEIVELKPDTIILLSPHAPSFADYFYIFPDASASGDMSEFGASEIRLTMKYDTEFAESLTNACADNDFPAGNDGDLDAKLDHATMVPLRFISDAGNNQQFVRIGITSLSLEQHFRLGQLIAKTAEQLNHRTIVVASGDLSHRLLDDGPYGYAPEGPEFDKTIQQIITSGNLEGLLDLSPEFCDKAGECGHRPLVIMAGCIGDRPYQPKLLSYEGPFGVGYGVASFHITASDHVKLARQTVETYVQLDQVVQSPDKLFPSLSAKQAGVFVSIKKLGELRGCIGTIEPTQPNIAQEIVANAINASTQDPRFEPIKPDELPYLSYSVDVLQPAESIDSPNQLDPKIYGVIVSLGNKHGLLLPNLDGIDSAEDQIAIAMQKADIPPTARNQIKLQRFRVNRYY